MKVKTLALGAFLASIIVIVLAACELNSRGAAIYQSQSCKDCHTLKGKGGAVGPNLTNIGSKRSRDYIVVQIKDPKTHNANTDMPSFRDKLSDQEINDLADYLSGLK
jgi:mono/diheme cytochrome c family protein